MFFYPKNDVFKDIHFYDQAREYAKYRDVLVVPLRFSKPDHGPEDHDFTGGLYDRQTLNPLRKAGLRRGKKQDIIRPAGVEELCALREASGYPDHGKPVVYLGTYFDHYGHLLFESLGRSWILFEPGFSPREGNYRYLFHVVPWCNPSLDSFPPAARTLCDALGLNSRNLILSTVPAAYRELIVPCALLTVRCSANMRHGRIVDLISRRIYPDAEPSTRYNEIVWLSRAGLLGARQASNERELEAKLRVLGFRIVCPETLELREQVKIFFEHRIFCGTIGSAFHTSLLARGGSLFFYVTGQQINSNFFLSDGIKGNRAIYCNALQTSADGVEFDIEKILVALRLCGLGGSETSSNMPYTNHLDKYPEDDLEPVGEVALRDQDGTLFLRWQDRVLQLRTRGLKGTPINMAERPRIQAIHFTGTQGDNLELTLCLHNGQHAAWYVDVEGTITAFRMIKPHAASLSVSERDPLWVRRRT